MIKEEKYLRAYFGPLSGYYVEVYEKYYSGKKFTFNVGPFFGGLFWWLYRKLYLQFFAIAGILFTLEIIKTFVFSGLDLDPKTSKAIFILQGLLLAVFLGFTGNYFYIKQSDNNIDKILSKTFQEDERIKLLKKKGGASWISVLLFFAFIVLLNILLENAANEDV